MRKIKNRHGIEIDFDVALLAMSVDVIALDDDLRSIFFAAGSSAFAGSEQSVFDYYCQLHKAHFGEEFAAQHRRTD